MVDFNSEHAVSSPPADILKLIILEERQHVTQAAEFFERCEYERTDGSRHLAEMYGSIRHLWRQVEGIARRRLKNAKGGDDSPTYEDIDTMVMSARTFEDMEEAFRWINKFLDDMGLTKIDTRRNFENMSVEEANDVEGL